MQSILCQVTMNAIVSDFTHLRASNAKTWSLDDCKLTLALTNRQPLAGPTLRHVLLEMKSKSKTINGTIVNKLPPNPQKFMNMLIKAITDSDELKVIKEDIIRLAALDAQQQQK